MELKQTNKKLIHIEMLRIFSAFLVIFNHTGSNGFFLFSERLFATTPYFIYMSFAIFCKVGVPIFFMISGALLLKKDLSIQDIIKKRILRMLIVLFRFFCFFLYKT